MTIPGQQKVRKIIRGDEQNRITIAVVFLATYLTIIFGLSDKIRVSINDINGMSILNDLVFAIFIVFGVLISSLFFLYLVFTALSLDFNKQKEVIFEQEVSEKKLVKVREKLFNAGVRSVFISFTFPVYYLFVLFRKGYGVWTSVLLWGFSLALIYILLFLVFKDD
ncbi:MAG: hypothetical protein HYY55_01730 [Candidatus Niyogibacteria bacterium]|nr:MAG: hypothetical protein HYY55_01730 [Candidatus Niyogibacteria bacterium]